MKNIILVVLFFFCLASLGTNDAVAQDVLDLDLEAAIDLALGTSENLKIEGNKSRIRQEELKEAKSAVYPQIESVTSWSSNVTYPNTGLIDDYDVSSGVTVDQLLFAFGRVSSAIRGAKKYIKISALNEEARERDVRYAAKLAYYAALLAQKTHAIVTQSYENAVANKKILEERSATGRVSKKDNIKISSDIATRQPTMYNALVDLKTAMNTLSRIIGVRGQEINLTSDFDDSNEELNAQVFREKLIYNEPRIKALEETVRLNKDVVQIRKSAFYPQVDAFASWTHTGSDGQANVDSDAVKKQGIAGIKVTVPIWNGGERFAELTAARLDAKNAELELEKQRNDLMLELDVALTQYRGLVEALVSYHESVRLAEESFKASQDLFGSGQISTTDLNDAELTLTNQRLNLETTRYYINISLAQIEKLASKGEMQYEN